jgi:prepilin-type N-terminal cleavage/methylation domain-containing protein
MITPPHTLRRGFTLMELIVAVAIMVLLISSIGLVFRSTSRSVGVSQSVMDMLSSTGAIQQQLEADVNNINRDGFLVIRSNTWNDNGIARRCDQISFLANGSFQHRTGTSTNTSPFTDPTTSASALIWWGQLALCQGTAPAAPTNARVYLKPDQTYAVPLTQVPTGLTDADFILGRSALLLFPKSTTTNNVTQGGTSFAAYQNFPAASPTQSGADYQAAPIPAFSTGETNAHITQSRIDAAAVTPGQLMAYVRQLIPGARTTANARYEADHYCYRHAALRTPYDNDDISASIPTKLSNGYFRMHTIALQGVPTMAIEWTDGSVYAQDDIDPVATTNPAQPKKIPAGSALIGTTRWYGMNNAQCGNNTLGVVDPGGLVPTYPGDPLATPGSTPDPYTAVFSFDNKDKWPVALRFRYHIADPTDRLPNGRDIVQVIKIPS